MRWILHGARHALLIWAVVVASPAAALAGAAPGTSLALYEGPDRMQRLAAAAKKEGMLMLYTSIAESASSRGSTRTIITIRGNLQIPDDAARA